MVTWRVRERISRLRCAVALATLMVGFGCGQDVSSLVPPTAERDARLPQMRIAVAGHARSIHLKTYGDPHNPLLLGLHGSLADFRSLRFLEQLSDAYFVVLWDQRGNGLSERISKAEYTFDSVVEEIRILHHHFDAELPVTLVGHSFGAMYAALYMSRYPEDVEQAVLIEPAGLNGDIFNATFADVFTVDLFNSALSETYWQNEVLSPSTHETMDYKALLLLADGTQMRYFCDPQNPPHLPVWRPGAFVEYVRGKRMGAGALGGSFHFDFAAGLTAFSQPVLLIGTACSALGSAFQEQYHLPLFGNARVAHVEAAGHRVIVERPDMLLDILRGELVPLERTF